ncbi:DNA-binding transcriptional LysR family regulator [Luteibacter rhizovicinus]|uniref:DNA-binding transcriptional LysR family regulator n=1 Tax=Luteibacter rhizovicinus TaxID=242606 RepID=A0A4R3YG28_9GAMM|nr:LysR family transcriptional regulator [Luteibacter rhizovicinus]TCV91106.1 DNA-binding transcriptional LysR family regulator [Luteibacter rhizovicinus]
MDLDPALLRAFVAVKEAGGFTRAAQRLHLTQSAISHQIRRLEEQVGRQLLYRTTRALTLTEDGEDLLQYAEKILQTLDSMGQRFRPSPISGAVRLGVIENFMGDRLPTLLCQFARAFPSVRLDVSVGMNLDLIPMIKAGELDLAVVMTAADGGDGTPLRRTQFVWVAAESFDSPPGASLPFAFFPAPCINRHVGLTALEGTSVEWHVVFTSPSQQGIRAAVLAGLAIAVLTRDDVEPGMRVLDGFYGLPSLSDVDFTLIWSTGGKTPAAVEFGKLIVDMAGLPGGAVVR